MLEKESRDNACFDDGSPEQKLLVKLLANPPKGCTMCRWMNHLNIEYDKQCTRRCRNGESFLSQRMQEAWAAGKYANRRPRGQGLKRGKEAAAHDEDEVVEDEIMAD